MRIALDARFIQDQYDGIGRYAYHLALSLAQGYPEHTFAIMHNPALPNTRFDMERLWQLDNVLPVPATAPLYFPQEQVQLPRLLRRIGADLCHVPYFPVPLATPCRLVVTITDLIFDRYPQFMPWPWFRPYYRLMTRLATARAARVLTISEATQRDLLSFYPVSPAKVQVTWPGVEPRFQPVEERGRLAAVRRRYGLPARFVLSVGSQRPHKNLARLVQAFASIADQADCDLVLVGKVDPRFPNLAADHAGHLGLAGRLHWTGPVAEEDLPALYSLAEVMAFPSLVEGFGLPALEAMACGTPVLASAASALPEVVGDAGMLVDPYDAEAMAQALLRLLEDADQRAVFRARGLARAATFAWSRTATQTFQAYEQALAA